MLHQHIVSGTDPVQPVLSLSHLTRNPGELSKDAVRTRRSQSNSNSSRLDIADKDFGIRIGLEAFNRLGTSPSGCSAVEDHRSVPNQLHLQLLDHFPVMSEQNEFA